MPDSKHTTAFKMPLIGLGTWRFGEKTARRPDEIAAVRHAIELGYRMIDTAEMYGEGGAEKVVGQALREALSDGSVSREDLTIVSKVYPHNASRAGTVKACEASLKRLGLDYLDTYLLHWRGSYPLKETVSAFMALKNQGAIRHFGVSNFDVDDMQELEEVCEALGAGPCPVNQIYYCLAERGPEFALLPWLARRRDVVPIPKAGSHVHLEENLKAIDLELSAEMLTKIDQLFAPPRNKRPLATI
jgi:diketogulonate reductase-like aldo/keto reductase